ncbi:tRNA pseudouridine synthase D [Maioricimonas rarisocia]|uniref:tRNA pseudouridine synthase D n=1 Tax=Maioricimonas rarisocia TaxID=2528026 RepID=A0A517ZBX5_9PLAN|nr:tRNA pseudouridine(13) synthase TruD [Maioricimonas rarisocia]QDU39967.1 tRNA pseudouridine synthase D [Maioricimonas rarisocia]
MKLKQVPEDFLVDELSNRQPSKSGTFSLYRLTKQSLGTPEAVDRIARAWKIPRKQISWGGLKDRHAITTQMLTIQKGPARDLERDGVQLEFLGLTGKPFTASDLKGNRFCITLRALDADRAERAVTELKTLARNGVPNYFDDQRFGSVGNSGEFVARSWIAGDYERALWLALADPHPFDRSAEKKQKTILRDHWGDWTTCKQELDRSHRRSVITYLCDHPTGFRKAFALIRPDMRSLYLSAYQSMLWNRCLAAELTARCRPEDLQPLTLKLGDVPCHASLPESERTALADLNIPLPSGRMKLQPGPLRERIEAVVAEEGLTIPEVKVKFPRDCFFSRALRPALLLPRQLSGDVADDELAAGRRKLVLRFELPPGAYATMIVKRLTALPEGS